MWMTRSWSLLTALASLILNGHASAQMQLNDAGSQDPLARFSSGIQPGCAEGVFGPGRSHSYRAAGYADVAASIPITPKTQFLVASMSKQFTALSIVMLADRRRLSLDDPARRWVPELAGAVGDATIDQLLHHTAGVRDHVNLLMLAGVEKLGDVDREATLRLMSMQRRTNFPPGTRARYSNGNYFVLAEIVSRVSGMPLGRFAEREIFRPLHMRRTSFLGAGTSRDLAQGYQPAGGPGEFSIANDRPSTNGSGGLITTIADLRKFDADFRARRVVWRPEILNRMLTPGRLNDGGIAVLPEFGTPYGMGLGLAQTGPETLVFHDGGAEGFRAEYARLLDAGISAAVLCNRVDAPAPAIARRALGFTQPPGAAGGERPAGQREIPPASLLKNMAGVFRAAEIETEYRFEPNGDGFKVTVTSSYARGTAPVEDWNGFRADPDGVLISGPIRIQGVESASVAQRLQLSFGARVEGLELERVPDQ